MEQLKTMNLVIIMRGGVQIETTYNWEEMKEALHEDETDGEVVVPLTYGKWACLTKNEIIGYLNI